MTNTTDPTARTATESATLKLDWRAVAHALAHETSSAGPCCDLALAVLGEIDGDAPGGVADALAALSKVEAR